MNAVPVVYPKTAKFQQCKGSGFSTNASTAIWKYSDRSFSKMVRTWWLNTWWPPRCLFLQPLLFALQADQILTYKHLQQGLSLTLSFNICWYFGIVFHLTLTYDVVMRRRRRRKRRRVGRAQRCQAWSCSVMRCWSRECVNFNKWTCEVELIAHTTWKHGWWWEKSVAKNWSKLKMKILLCSDKQIKCVSSWEYNI